MAVLVSLLLALLVATAGAVRPRQQEPTRAECNGGLLRLKAWADYRRFDVDHRVTPTNLTEIYRITPPPVLPRDRVSRWQRRQWALTAQAVEFKRDHGETRLVLYWDQNKYINVVLVPPACLYRQTRQRERIIAAYRKFSARCGTPTDGYRSLGAVVRVTGVGHWANRFVERRGQAPSGAELHPVTAIDFIAGCGA